jgi:hypothetical protein
MFQVVLDVTEIVTFDAAEVGIHVSGLIVSVACDVVQVTEIL